MIKSYQKDSEYSYTLGFFPTIELLQNKKADVICIYLHSSAVESDGYKKIVSLIGMEKIIIANAIINKLSDKDNCFAVGVFNKYKEELEQCSDHVVLVNPSDMGNLGTIIRTMVGFNFFNLALITPCADHFNPKVLRASMGAFFKTRIELFSSFEEYNKKYSRQSYSFMLQAKNGLCSLEVPSLPLAFVFGNEATGLPHSFLNKDSVIIEQTNKIDSLNLPTAVAVALYTLSWKRKR